MMVHVACIGFGHFAVVKFYDIDLRTDETLTVRMARLVEKLRAIGIIPHRSCFQPCSSSRTLLLTFNSNAGADWANPRCGYWDEPFLIAQFPKLFDIRSIRFGNQCQAIQRIQTMYWR